MKLFSLLPNESNVTYYYFYRPQTKFAKVMFLHLSVSHSVHGGGVCSQGGYLLRGGVCSWGGAFSGGGVCSQGGAWWRHPLPDGYCCRQYASYWNAFLYFLVDTCPFMGPLIPVLDFYWCLLSVVDQGFPWGGAPTPRGVPTNNFAKFSQKLHEIERIWTPRGAHIPHVPLRSTTASGLQSQIRHLYSHLAEAYVMYVPWDLPLMQHLLTSWWPTWQPVTVPQMDVSSEVGCLIWTRDLPQSSLTC